MIRTKLFVTDKVRMTIGQLVECLVGKTAALQGMDADGTAFEEYDLESIKNKLEELGYDRNGYEYLYNGMTGEKMKVAIFIGPTYYQRLKHLVEDKLHCLTMDHEVLTYDGWKTYDKLKMSDKIATLVDGELQYVKPIDIFYFPNFNKELYHIKSQQVDLTVTMNHRMYVATSKGAGKFEDFDLIKASEIVGKHVKYQKNAKWHNDDYQFVLPGIQCNNGVNYPDKNLNMDAWLKFFGIWMAEGWTTISKDHRYPNSNSHKVQICQCKPRVQKILNGIMTDFGFHYNQIKDKFTINHKQLYEYMSKLSVGAPHKQLPEWVWKLSTRQCKILLENMIIGDGSIQRNTSRYYTSSIKLADDVMRLALHCGWSSNKLLHCKAGNVCYIKGKKVTSNYDMWILTINKCKNTPSVNHSHVKEQNIQVEEVYKSKEPVFCLEVPSEVFYVRRNGKAVWTGNSRSRGPTTSLTRQAPEGTVRIHIYYF
ncbi:MAG: hypothetical protein EBQ92_00680 [Proteobacteria bacterium]|nr:hypothetical protein [Pseudomonadota bacterium]